MYVATWTHKNICKIKYDTVIIDLWLKNGKEDDKERKYKNINLSWVVLMAHTFNPNTRKAEAGRYMSWRPA